jgi:hypothetical protein
VRDNIGLKNARDSLVDKFPGDTGDGLCVGYDSGNAVSAKYRTPGTLASS